MTTSPSTIAEAEECIQQGLERLRDLPLSDPIVQALSFVAPKGYRIVVQLEEEGRKKRSTASISNWNHSSGEIVMFFEPITAPPEQTPRQGTVTKAFGPNATTGNPLATDAPVVAASEAILVSIEQQLRECCLALAEAEKSGRQFYALKWFRDTYLPDRGYEWAASLQERQKVLNRAIEDGYIQTQTIPNPKNAAFPVTTILLNREKAKPYVGERFRPMVIRGESLSATVIRDRR